MATSLSMADSAQHPFPHHLICIKHSFPATQTEKMDEALANEIQRPTRATVSKYIGTHPFPFSPFPQSTKSAHVNDEFGMGANNPMFVYNFSTGGNTQYGQSYMLDATRQLTNVVGLETAHSETTSKQFKEEGEYCPEHSSSTQSSRFRVNYFPSSSLPSALLSTSATF